MSQIPLSAVRRSRLGLYTVGQVAEALGANYNTLWGHLKAGYIAKPSHGKGKRKYYSEKDVERIRAYWLGES